MNQFDPNELLTVQQALAVLFPLLPLYSVLIIKLFERNNTYLD